MYKKKDGFSPAMKYIIPLKKKLNSFNDTSKKTSLPDKNENGTFKFPHNNMKCKDRTESGYREKINNSNNVHLSTIKKEGESEFDSKRRLEIKNTYSWQKDLDKYGWAKCLKVGCNFLSSDLKILQNHYRDCDGVPRYNQNYCSSCGCYLISFEAHNEHVVTCREYDRFNEKGFRYGNNGNNEVTRRRPMRIPPGRFLMWREEITKQGSARCGYQKCSFVSMSLADLEEHYVTRCIGGRVTSRNCAYCNFKYSTQAEYLQHKPKCQTGETWTRDTKTRDTQNRDCQTRDSYIRDSQTRWENQTNREGQQTRDSYCRDSQTRDSHYRENQTRESQTRDSYCRESQTHENVYWENQTRDSHYRETQTRDSYCRESQTRENYCRDSQTRDSHYRENQKWNRSSGTNQENGYTNMNPNAKNKKKEKKMKLIVQPEPEFGGGTYRSRRPYSKHHIKSWRLTLEKYKYIKCIYENCYFIALSLEDMICHFGYCNSDSSFAKFVCPYCKGRVTSRAVLMEHIERSHWSNYGMILKKNFKLEEKRNRLRHASYEDEQPTKQQTTMWRIWQKQIYRYGYAFCTKLQCNYMATSVVELDFHLQTCDGRPQVDMFVCNICNSRLPTRKEFEEHKFECNGIERLRAPPEERRFLREYSPFEFEQREIRTYSRKRKVDVDLDDSDVEIIESGNSSDSCVIYEVSSDRSESREAKCKGSGGKKKVIEIEILDEESQVVKEKEPEKVEKEVNTEPVRINVEGIEEGETNKIAVEEEEEDESKRIEIEKFNENEPERVEMGEGEDESYKIRMEEDEEPEKVIIAVSEEIEEGKMEESKEEGEVELSQFVYEESEEELEKPQFEIVSALEFDKMGFDESEEDSEKAYESMEIDHGLIEALIESIDVDSNEAYREVGNEVEVFETTESSQGIEMDAPKEGSQDIVQNEDGQTMDDGEQSNGTNEQTDNNGGVEENNPNEDSQGVEQNNRQNEDTPSDETRDNTTNNEGENSGEGEGRKEEDDNEEESSKKVEKESEETEEAEETEEVEQTENDEEGVESEKKEEIEQETKESNEEKCEETKAVEEKIESEVKESETIEESKEPQRKGEDSVEKCPEDESEDKANVQTEQTKETKKVGRRKARKSEESKEIEKDKDKGEESEEIEKVKKAKEGKRTGGRRSKKWSEHDGEEEYVPKGITKEEDSQQRKVETITKRRGRRSKYARETSASETDLVGSKKEETKEEVKCGKCDYRGPREEFNDHNWTKHVGLGWIEGEKEVDLNDEEEVIRLVKTAFRVTKRGVCEICQDVKRSYMGFVTHVQICGKTESEMDALKVKCPYCKAKYLKYSLKSHIYVYHSDTSGKDKVKIKSKDGDTDGDGDVESDAAAAAARDLDQSQKQDEDKEKVKDDDGIKESGKIAQESRPQEPVVSSSKRKSALRAVSKFQEVFKETDEPEKEEEPSYIFYEKSSGKLPKLCSKLTNYWYSLKRKKKKIPCRHQQCKTTCDEVKDAKLHYLTCSQLPDKVYLCEVCEFYSVEEGEMKSHLTAVHKKTTKRGKGGKDDADMEFGEKEGIDEEECWEEAEEEEEEEVEEEEIVEGSDNEFERCDSVYERQRRKRNRKKADVEEEKKVLRKRAGSELMEDDVTELTHKQNFCERERLENVRGDRFYSNALRMTRQLEEEEERKDNIEDDEEVEEEEEEEEDDEDSELKNSGAWPQLHTEMEDWCRISREVSSVHLPEVMESISVSFTKGDKKETKWRRFKRFEGDIVEEVPVLFLGGSVRSMSWCKVSFRRMLEKSVKQYLAVSTAKNVDHLTDVHERRKPFTWNLVQIWDCGALENASPVEKPKFCLGIFQEGGEIWDMLWFPEDTYEKGSDGRLTRIGILATASDDGAVRIWSICDPSQIVFNSRLPLFITEPLVKLIIDTFLEDSCVRLSIGRDGVVAGGYVNGCLAVWNLKNITSPFCGKIGKCVVIRPHLIIQAHRTSITALSFCPNNNRYITSGGLDRVVKLWDLESPWVPIEQYHKELCLDNIWPKNWPLNIYNFDDVLPNNRKGVVRFLKDVITTRQPPCLMLENTCLSLTFSDWLNAVCGANNTGEVKIRFLKNFLQEQKKQEKDQSTISSLRLEALNDQDDSESSKGKESESSKSFPKTYEELNGKFGLVIKEHDARDKGKPLGDKYHPEEFPIRAVNKVSFNPNFKSFTHVAVGYNCGLIRIQRLKELQSNNALKSFSENAKKPRL